MSLYSKTFLTHIPPNSPLCKINPLTKLSFLLVFSVVPIFVENQLLNLGLLAVVLIVLVLTRLPLSKLLQFSATIMALLSLTMISYTFLFAGRTVLYELGPLRVTYEGLYYSTAIYVRVLVMSFGGITYLFMASDRDILSAFTMLGLPYVAPFVLCLTLRAITLLLEDYQHISIAQRSRGLELEGVPITRKIKNGLATIVPITMLALRRSFDMATALDSRGFLVHSAMKRSSYHASKIRLRPIDFVLISVMAVSSVSILVMRFAFGMFLIKV